MVVAERLRDVRRAPTTPPLSRSDAVDAAQELRRRNVPQREASQGGGVGVAGEEHGVARRAVAARAADHLDVALERVGVVDERDEPHVGLVDPHPERRRRDDDGRPAGDERLLDARPLVRLEPGVVMRGADAVTDERPRDLLARAARARVDDRRRAAERPQSAEEGAERSSPFSARSTS